MATNNVKKASAKPMNKKAMKSVKGGGGLIIDRSGSSLTADSGVMVPELDCRKAGGDQTTY